MSTPNTRGVPPEDVERLLERHVRRHVRNAVADLLAAMEPMRERTIYHGSPILREIEAAHRAATVAARAVEGWRIRTAEQPELGEEPPPECFELDETPAEARAFREAVNLVRLTQHLAGEGGSDV
jgi:hypothetical protein